MIPFVKYGGLKFLEAAHVKDVLSILKWADNPRNRLAGFRAARLIPGVGAATARKLLDLFDKAVESTVSDGGIQDAFAGCSAPLFKACRVASWTMDRENTRLFSTRPRQRQTVPDPIGIARSIKKRSKACAEIDRRNKLGFRRVFMARLLVSDRPHATIEQRHHLIRDEPGSSCIVMAIAPARLLSDEETLRHDHM